MDCRVKPGNDAQRGRRIMEHRHALMFSGSLRQNGLHRSLASFRQNVRYSFLGFVSPNRGGPVGGGDCFVALRAPRNDGG